MKLNGSPYRNNGLEEAICRLETAKADGQLPESIQHRIDTLCSVRAKVGQVLIALLVDPFHRNSKKYPALPEKAQTTDIITQAAEEILKLRVSKAYDKAVEAHQFFGLAPQERIPDFERVLQVFTPKMLIAAGQFLEPAFILTAKGVSFIDMLAAMNAHKTIKGQESAQFEEMFGKHAMRKQKKWGAYIVDGADVMDDILPSILPAELKFAELKLEVRVRLFRRYRPKCVGGMDRWKMAGLMMLRQTEGSVVDRNGRGTILDEDPAIATPHFTGFFEVRVPVANWDVPDHRFEFRKAWYGSTLENVHFRRSVGGRVQAD